MNSEMAHCYHRRIRLGSARYVSSETVVIFASNNASINVKPKREGGGGGGGKGPREYMGHLTSIAFPTLGNLTKNLRPRVGRLLFLRGGMGPSHIV